MLKRFVTIAILLMLSLTVVGCGGDNKKATSQPEKSQSQAQSTTQVESSAKTESALQKESDDFKRKYNGTISKVSGATNLTIGNMKVTDGSAFGLSHYEFSNDLMIDFYHDKDSKKVNEFMIKVFTRSEYDDNKKRKNIDDGINVFIVAIKAYDPNADVEAILDKIEARRPLNEWNRDTEFTFGGITYYTEGGTDLCTLGITK